MNRNYNKNYNSSSTSTSTCANDHDHEVTEGALQIWRNLPEKIREDPSLASFQEENKRLHLNSGSDYDPLPSASNDDNNHFDNISMHINDLIDNNNKNNNQQNDLTINTVYLESVNNRVIEGGAVDLIGDGLDGNIEGQHASGSNIKQFNNNNDVNSCDGGGSAAGGGGGDKVHNKIIPIITIGIVNNNQETDHHTHDKKSRYKIFKIIKILLLLIVWCLTTGFLMCNNEMILEPRQLSISSLSSTNYLLNGIPKNPRISVTINGAFNTTSVNNDFENYLYVYVQLLHLQQNISNNNNSNGNLQKNNIEITHTENITTIWKIPIIQPQLIDKSTIIKRSMIFEFGQIEFDKVQSNNAQLRIRLKTNLQKKYNLPIQLIVNESPINRNIGVLYAACVLLGLYIMIIWEIVHRTFAAIIASTLAIGILSVLNEKPTMSQIISWIDVETLLLLFGMMIIVAILSETGFFDYVAVYAYKITGGRVWPLINCLCFFTAIMSSFLDNVTTVLLMTPVSIRLCEVMGLNPVPILMSMIIYSNIGGALTPVGDPPNVIIASNNIISKKGGVTFTIFTMHMALGVIMVMIQTYFQLRYKFRNQNDLRFSEPQDVQEMRHEISVWQRAAASLSSYSKDEDLVRETLMKKVQRLKRNLKKKQTTSTVQLDNYEQTLEQLQQKYPIRSKPLLIKSGFALTFVISFFFLHSVPELQRLSLGWTALLGAILLLILADKEDMEGILARVEWSTLLFFAALFVLMESLSELGLIDWIGKQTEMIILSVDKDSRLAVAVLLILWVSAIASAFVDNIPLTTMMVKITISLAENTELGLPLQPLIWALAFGACLGGNGTLIGASANVVCAGVAEQHGYRFTFIQYFKIGFPIMIGNILVATVYLMFVHVLFQWH